MNDRFKRNHLRKKAETRLSTKKDTPLKISPEDLERLVDELQVHQVELEMQNEELREAQEEIEESRRKYMDLYDFAPVGYLTLDEKGVITEANFRGAGLLGIERGLLPKTPFHLFIMPEDRERFRECQRKAFQIPGKQSCEFRVKRTAADPVWVSAEGLAMEGPDGKLTGMRLALSDITDRKRAEEEVSRLNAELEAKVRKRTDQLGAASKALKQEMEERARAEEEIRKSERGFRGIFELSSVGMAERDARTGLRIRVNQRLCEMTGYSPEELLSGKDVRLTHPDDRKRNREARKAVLKGEADTWSIEKRYVRKNGEGIWVLVNGNLIRDHSGRPFRTVAVIQDITKRKRAEIALQEKTLELQELNQTLEGRVRERTEELEKIRRRLQQEHQRLSDVLETLPAYLILLTPDYHVVFANRFFRERFGESHGRRCFEYLFGQSEACEICETYTVLKTKAPHHWEWTGPDNRNYDIYDFPFTDVEGSPLILEMGIDITAYRQTEAALRERTEELSKSQERLQQLASQLLLAQERERKRVAVELHDGLMSELAATKYLLEAKLMLLERGKQVDSGEMRRIAEILSGAIKEARRLMNNLHPSILDELGLTAAVSWLSGEYQQSYPHIVVEKEIAVPEEDISASVKFVIYRVLQESLNNFARHGNGDRVKLSLSKSGRTFGLVIRDNGQGFEVERVQKGLGLESMRERVELSGGEFRIESVIGRGTVIRATWKT